MSFVTRGTSWHASIQQLPLRHPDIIGMQISYNVDIGVVSYNVTFHDEISPISIHGWFYIHHWFEDELSMLAWLPSQTNQPMAMIFQCINSILTLYTLYRENVICMSLSIIVYRQEISVCIVIFLSSPLNEMHKKYILIVAICYHSSHYCCYSWTSYDYNSLWLFMDTNFEDCWRLELDIFVIIVYLKLTIKWCYCTPLLYRCLR